MQQLETENKSLQLRLAEFESPESRAYLTCANGRLKLVEPSEARQKLMLARTVALNCDKFLRDYPSSKFQGDVTNHLASANNSVAYTTRVTGVLDLIDSGKVTIAKAELLKQRDSLDETDYDAIAALVAKAGQRETSDFRPAQSGKPSSQLWWIVERGGLECIATEGPAAKLDSFGGLTDRPEARDFRGADGSLAKVEIAVSENRGQTERVWMYYKVKADCERNEVNKTKSQADRYR
jgi:hypothetical protein